MSRSQRSELTSLYKTITNILMTRDQNPLIDIPTFISTPIINMVSEMSCGGHNFLKQLCTAIQTLDESCDEQGHFASLLTLIDSLMSASPEDMQQVARGNYTVSTIAPSSKLSLKSSLLVTWYSTDGVSSVATNIVSASSILPRSD